MDNLQKSEKVIAVILDHLLKLGLQESDLDENTLQLDDNLKPFLTQCLKWLISEGVVRVENYHDAKDGVFFAYNPSITSYGCQILGTSLELNGGTQKLGNALREVASTEKSYSQVGDFFGGLLGGFTKSIGSG